MIQAIQFKFLKSFCILTSVIFILGSSACKSTKEISNDNLIVDNKKSETLAKSLLWEISGNGLEKPSYLYGTIHLIKSESFFYPSGTLQAFENSEEIFFEIDMNEMSDMSAMMGLMDKLYMTDGSSLKTLLSEENYMLVSEHFKKIGLPMMMFERMKPMFLTAFASEDMEFGNMLNPGQSDGQVKSYEFEFLELAKSMNKSVSGLETIEFQLSIFEQIPYKDQAQMLVESIKSGTEGSDQLEVLTKVYVEQDIQSMVSMMDDEGMGLGEYEDVLLKNRNENWIPIMEKEMLQKSCFFAVGAGHLAGEHGVIGLLKKSGYKMTPLSARH